MNLVKRIFELFKERSLLLMGIFLTSLVAIFLAYYLGGAPFASTFIIPFIALFLGVSKDIWSSDSGQTVVAKLSIVAIVALVFGASVSPIFTSILLEPLYESIPALKGKIPDIPTSLPLMVVAVIAILVVNYLIRDPSAMKKHPTPLEQEFPERDYKVKLRGFCKLLKDHLDRIERENNWSSELFVPLDAEVEIKQSTKILRKKKDLLSAIKGEKKTKVFLVIGQPGAGKSVALRKLCRDLLEEVESTGKIPIYINLKEWSSSWSNENLPNIEDFHAFILKSLKNQGDRFTNDFLRVYFDRMVENGRVFFIFDSFDEIPTLLEDEKNSQLAGEISKIIYRYLNGAHDSRGIVSTRPYKSPTNDLLADTTIRILPLTEQRVVQAMRKYPTVKESSIRELLTVRRDLLPVAKNPFYCALLVNYLQDNDDNLPQNRSQLFQSYIEKRLEDCAERVEEKGLTVTDVTQVCQETAGLMFNSETFGFEILVTEVQKQVTSYTYEDIKNVIEILVYSKIGRHSNSEKTLFTFSHKRFAEYFAVLSRLGNENENLLKDIHTDGKWRDVLVLLVELESNEKSSAIAVYTWQKLVAAHNELIKSGKTFSLTAIHGLRFLKDAFLQRKQSVSPIQENLGIYIWIELTGAETILEKKISLECIGLLNEETINITVLEAFRQNNDWLSETALKSCFYLNSIEPKLEKSLLIYLDSISIFSFILKFRSNLFLLRLSDNFSSIVKFLFIRLLDCFLILLLFSFHILQNPVVCLIFFAAVLLKLYGVITKAEKFSVLGVMAVRFEAASIPIVALSLTNILNFALTPTGTQIIKWDTPNWLVLYSFLILIPWYQIYYYFIKFRNSKEITYGVISSETKRTVESSLDSIIKSQSERKFDEEFNEVKRNIKSALYFILAGVFILVLYANLSHFLPDYIKPYLYFIWGLFLLITIYLVNLKNTYFHILDKRLNKKFYEQAEFSRSAIETHFYKLRTREGRLDFVIKLGTMGSSPTGEWLSKLPNVDNDEGSTRLAQLEESWRNLDR